MALWTIERGSLWALETSDGPPPRCPPRIDTTFREFGLADAQALAGAMGQPSSDLVVARLRAGRRCFGLLAAEQIACYGWATRGVESVGELERDFNLCDDEAYIWDCVTLPQYRGSRCYSALLSQMVAALQGEGLARIWIGASRQNQPSIQGFANAGFDWVLDLTYRRLFRLTMLRFYRAPAVSPALLGAAYRLILAPRERRVGPLAIGLR